MPLEIAVAINKVQSNVKRLARAAENKYDRYNYTSADDFLEHVGQLEAEAGLFTIAEELESSIAKTGGAWLAMKWAIYIGHISGQLYGPIHRSISVPADGAQAYGSAQSYVLKQFMRGLYKVPTGDTDDADAKPKEPLPPSAKPAKEKPFVYKTASPQERTEYLLARVPTLDTLESCAESMKKLKEPDVGKEGYSEIMRAITSREAIITERTEQNRQLKLLADMLKSAISEEDFSIASDTWDEMALPGDIRERGHEILREAQKKFQPQSA